VVVTKVRLCFVYQSRSTKETDVTQSDFEELCRHASLALDLPDTSAMAQGVPALIDDVWIELVFDQRREGLAIFAELGEIPEENRIVVYESLLSLQLMTWDQPSIRFGLNMATRTPLLCASAPLKPESSGEWLAANLKRMAAQVKEWRGTLLVGKLMQVEDDLDENLEGAQAAAESLV
jgi:hypothetical protein